MMQNVVAALKKEVDFPRHTAVLRAATKEHTCAVCKGTIGTGSLCYGIVLWNAGMSGHVYPDYVHTEHLEAYMASFDQLGYKREG
jgi:hypothetical protein